MLIDVIDDEDGQNVLVNLTHVLRTYDFKTQDPNEDGDKTVLEFFTLPPRRMLVRENYDSFKDRVRRLQGGV